ncbi:hypothetical protein HGM15179_016572 [Zosterops borbonicus]|uniref:Uncharacterized protein n=1 Tax=Zosterops borbonicus TaxID=364589 RepID=A0A8K1G2P2_9PASS|nr:hypothetical protein HGM15179_016572 [Zosterops borbonicus]
MDWERRRTPVLWTPNPPPPPTLTGDKDTAAAAAGPPVPPPHGARAAPGSPGGRTSRLCQDGGSSGSSGREGISHRVEETPGAADGDGEGKEFHVGSRGPASPSTVVASECEM